MYRKIVWCYAFILTLLDLTLNTKLTAQGKSHGVSIQETFAEGVTFQEWGTEEPSEEHEHERNGGGVASLRFSPGALRFGVAALGAAHVATVTVHNTANSTLHLASVAGTTSDFYASFFDTKSVPPEGNTTFSVVYVGRREGYVGAHLFLHTSRGVHRYPVSAMGVPSGWGLWPLVGLRVPYNATLKTCLYLSNPTAEWVQVQEVYSSAGWLRLALPHGGPKAPQDNWLLPPRASREIVRLLIALPDHVYTSPPEPPVDAPNLNPLTGYIRIKTNVTESASGSGLLLAVEVRAVPAGHFVEPLQLRLPSRGTGDPPDSWEISLGNSGGELARAEGGVWAARCSPQPASLPDPFADGPDQPAAPHAANGVKPEGAHLAITRPLVEPYQELTPTARFTLDYNKLGEALSRSWGGAAGARAAEGGWCGGWLRLGGSALQYSVRLLPGTARLTPDDIRVVTSSRELALREREVRLANEFALPLRVSRLQVPPDVAEHFVVSDLWDGVLAAGSSGVVARLRLRRLDAQLELDASLALHTNVTRYVLPLAVYSGHLQLEWEWVNATSSSLDLGVVGLSSTRHVALRVRNPAPRPLCVTRLESELAGAQLALDACAHLKPKPVPVDHPCRCVAAGGSARGELTVLAPARRGPQRGVVALHTPHARTHTTVALRAEPGRVAAAPLLLDPAAPYAWATADLVVDSTMELRMRVVAVEHGGDGPPDPAVEFLPDEEGEVREGRRSVGVVRYAAERLCEPACYTGLGLDVPEGALWEERAARWDAAALAADAMLLQARRDLFQRQAARGANVSLLLHTSHALHVRVRGSARLRWPRLAGPAAKGWAGLAGVGAQAALRLSVRNPSPSHRLLLQPALGAPLRDPPLDLWEGSESPFCRSERCVYSAEAFTLGEWRVTRGAARLWRPAAAAPAAVALPLLLLEPNAELELKVLFAPPQPALLSAYLYLRNNLTVVEGLQLAGRGAIPSFEVAGRQPGSTEPILFEVTECGAGGQGAGGAVRLAVTARNTGRVGVRLRDWRVAGRACAARGFAVAPCQPLQLAPNQSAPLRLTFSPDWTLGRAHAELLVHTDLGPARFQLAAAVPAPLLPRCAAQAHRAAPPLEQPLRATATFVALALVVLVVAAAALDAERLLRKARQQRQPAPVARAPLDLRHVAQHVPSPSPPTPAPRAPPPRRRRARKPDPAAESRAFERWRAALARHDDDSSRSSEDADADDASPLEAGPPPGRALRPDLPPPDDGADTAEERPRSSSGDDDAASSGEDSSSPPDDDDPRPPPPPRESARASRAPPRDRSPASSRAAPLTPEPDESADVLQPGADAPSRPRARAGAGDCPRRVERRAADADAPRSRSSAAKHHLRKDKPKRRERPPPTPPRSSPPTFGEARPPQPSPPGSAPPGVRWGASWSSVVARSSAASPPAPLAPIGPVARRAEPEPVAPRAAAGDHSLFFFNGDPSTPPLPPVAAAPTSLPARADPDFSWRTSQPDRSAFAAPATDYLASGAHAAVSEDAALGSVGGAYGSIGRSGPSGPVWGGALEARAPGAAWPWPPQPQGAVRPPPGFGTPPPAAGARPFDPFRSLAAIWTPSTLDWRTGRPADDE